MITVQMAQTADKEQIKALWSLCFGDSGPFMDWFFSHRFVPRYTACIKEGERLVGAMQSYPLHILIRGVSLPCAIIAGVSIHPDFRGQGLMKKMFSFYMNEMRKKGIMVTPHTPAHLPTFFSFGHYPVTDTAYATMEKAEGRPSLFVSEVPLGGEADSLLSCYSAFARSYSGMIDRSMADFQLKMDDYRADGARCLAWRHRGEVLGYLVYYSSKEVKAEECIALSSPISDELLSHLAFLHPGKKISAKLSPYLPLSLPDFSVTIRPKGVMGVVHMQQLLHSLLPKEGAPFTVQVEDPILPANCGLFTLSGQPTKTAPQVSLSCGRLAQLLCGYYSLDELVQNNMAVIYDPDAAREIDRLLPKMPCFIVDEY